MIVKFEISFSRKIFPTTLKEKFQTFVIESLKGKFSTVTFSKQSEWTIITNAQSNEPIRIELICADFYAQNGKRNRGTC